MAPAATGEVLVTEARYIEALQLLTAYFRGERPVDTYALRQVGAVMRAWVRQQEQEVRIERLMGRAAITLLRASRWSG